MEITIVPPAEPLPCERAWAMSMTIRSFKGRREVEAHLFRPAWPEAEEQDADLSGLVDASSGPEADRTGSRRVILESFTTAERDQLAAYLREHYASRLAGVRCVPLEFPVPAGLTPLSAMDEGKSIGLIRFERIPHFHLPFPVRGLYDLSQHRPIVESSAQVEDGAGD